MATPLTSRFGTATQATSTTRRNYASPATRWSRVLGGVANADIGTLNAVDEDDIFQGTAECGARTYSIELGSQQRPFHDRYSSGAPVLKLKAGKSLSFATAPKTDDGGGPATTKSRSGPPTGADTNTPPEIRRDTRLLHENSQGLRRPRPEHRPAHAPRRGGHPGRPQREHGRHTRSVANVDLRRRRHWRQPCRVRVRRRRQPGQPLCDPL